LRKDKGINIPMRNMPLLLNKNYLQRVSVWKPIRKISVSLQKDKFMSELKQNSARFDTRLSIEQKQFFEKAALLGGYRSLTDFILKAVQEKAKEIIDENERILESERDKEVFFEALLNPPVPNQNLLEAKEDYNKLIGE
jgi:uncharacterized protein (DUF1778 family)